MKIYGNVLTEDLKIEGKTAIALGKFDGIHRGHKMLIDRLIATKEKEGNNAAVFTFERAPGEFINNITQKHILTKAEKRTLMKNNGIDILIECPLINEIISMEPEKFVKEILIDRLCVEKIFCGEDFRFGYKRKGDAALLEKLQEEYGYKVEVIKKLQYKDRDISSTFTREAIQSGDIKLANRLLGYPYTIIGTVSHGRALGRKIGFPTINIIPDEDKILPPNGVYDTVVIHEGIKYQAITNIGTKPTVTGDNKIIIETNLLDVSMDLYDKTVEICFLDYVRQEKKFDSIEELKNVIAEDVSRRRMSLCTNS